jgi:hypothetical protein
MAEPTTFPEDHISEPVAYQRISAFAIAGLIIAIGYAVVLAFAAFLSLRFKDPLLLPVWGQVVPLLGAVLSVLALWSIRNSGGVLTGTKLAQTACWLSVVLGLGYTSYYMATRFAIINQANDFTMKWFKKLEEGDIGGAFLDTRDPAHRKGINSKDETRINAQFAGAMGNPPEGSPRGTLDLFRETEAARILGQGDALKEFFAPQITPRGVIEWDYKNHSYTVQRTYVISTYEGSYLAVVTATGMESLRGEFTGREWLLNQGELKLQPIQRYPISMAVEQSMPLSAQFVGSWLEKLLQHDREGAFLDTKPPAERSRLRTDNKWATQVLMGTLAAGTGVRSPSSSVMAAASLVAQRELADRQYLPGYGSFCSPEFLTTDKFLADFDATKEIVPKALQQLFQGGAPKMHLLDVKRNCSRRFWQLKQEEQPASGATAGNLVLRLQLPHDCVISLRTDREYDAYLIITTEIPDDGKATDWRIVSAELVGAARKKVAPK